MSHRKRRSRPQPRRTDRPRTLEAAAGALVAAVIATTVKALAALLHLG
ncbi:hypothetical protein [Streptomyces sp. ISL-11]|nr:hypothetical protein [Streptomyces sp. ISL-11]MBT2384484.1 hypothetical protein [Streptomyces sp. ISL-11]